MGTAIFPLLLIDRKGNVMVRVLSALVAVGLLLVAALPVGAQSPPTYTPTLLKAAAPLPGSNGVAFDDRDVLWVGSAGGAISNVDKETGEVLQVFGPGPEWGADDMVFGPDGALYHTAILNGTVGRLDPDGTHANLNSTPLPGVNPIAFSDDGRLFVGLLLMGDALYEFDAQSLEEPRLIAEGLGLNGFDWLDGYLYAPRYMEGEVVRIDVDSGEVTVVASGFGQPNSVDVGPDGMLYVNDNGSGQIVQVDPDTGDKTLVAEIGGDNMDFDASGRLFLSSNDSGRLVEIMTDGSVREVSPPGLVASPTGITAMTADDGTTTVYIPDIFRLHAVDGRTGAELTPAGGLEAAAMTAAASGTNVVLSSWFAGALQVWDPDTGEVVADLAPSLTGPALDAVGFGDRVVVSELGAEGPAVVAIDPASGERTRLAPMVMPSGLATDGVDLWAADWAVGTVSQVIDDGATIEPVPIASGLAQPEGLAVAPDGSLLVAETGAGRISRIEPATGTVTPLVEGLDFGMPASALLPPVNTLAGVAVDDAGSLYIATVEGVFRYDPEA